MLTLGILESADGGGGSATLTVPSGSVGSNLTGFPLYIDFSEMPAGFWSTSNDGWDLRASVSGSQVPCDIVWVDPYNQRGAAFVKVDIASGSNTVVDLTWDGSATKPAVGSSYGRNAVWSDYESVLTFGVSNEDRTGKRASTFAAGDANNFTRATLHTFTQDPHQGIAYDHDNDKWYVFGTNAIYRFSEDFSTLEATNSDPCGDANTGTGETLLDHLCDGCVANGYIVIPINDYVGSSGTETVAYIARFDLSTLAFVDAVEITSTSLEASGICWDYENGRYVVCQHDPSGFAERLHIYNTSFALTGTITLPEGHDLLQGIEFWQGAYYISNDDTDEIYRVELDGTTQDTGLVGDTVTGNYEGIAHYKGSLVALCDPSAANSFLRRYVPFTETLYVGQGSEHQGSTAQYKEHAVTALGTTWTMACSYEIDTVTQMALVTYRDSTSGATNDRATLTIDDGNKVGIWDNVNSWMYASPNIDPGTAAPHRVATVYAGTNRKLFHDGAQVNSATITARDAGFNMLTIGSDDETRADPLDGKIGFVYLRSGALSADWLAAEFDNLDAPGTFYSIS